MTTQYQNASQGSWHAKRVEDIFLQFATSEVGLIEQEAKKRLSECGRNELHPQKRRSSFIRFFSQFNSLLIYILLGAACITLLLGNPVDTVVILTVVFINAIIGFFQEGKAERAIEAVSRMLPAMTTVIREERQFKLPVEELVLGDIVVLQSGDKVGADIRLFNIKNLKISEAILTGESEAVEKSAEVLPEETVVNDRQNMAFSGTLVTSGKAHGVVVATADETEIGKISQLLSTVSVGETPLLRKISIFSRWLTLFILASVSFIFIYGLLTKLYTVEQMLMASVSIAVAAIPEGLPIILTITLAIGVQRMAKHNAVIRLLPAVETLGSVMIICSDKTGTLTKNEMTVQKIFLGEREITVTGDGYEPNGEFYEMDNGLELPEEGDLQELCKAAMLCNDANFHMEAGTRKLQGDPTEGALLTIGLNAGFQNHLLKQEFPLKDVIPFESEHRFMATLHHDHAGHGFVYVKGAPEVVLQYCNKERRNGEDYPIHIKSWEEKVAKLASSGQRTLAIAFKAVSPNTQELLFTTVENDLVLLGIVGIMDKPRPEAIASIAECHRAGINVKMITGDHAITALAVARELGIESPKVLTGSDFDHMSPEEFLKSVEENNVFARTNPEHKLKLVTALQSKGYILAMTGDGVNDAPALKRADIGIAMGMNGTEAAKEASEMVLTDDNFASIVQAVKEGRTVYDNLKKVILFLLPINGGESLGLALAILFGYTLPITPLQILWVNMVSSVLLAMALAFEPTEKRAMERPPTPRNESLLSRHLVWRIVYVSTFFLIGIFGVFQWGISQGYSLETARTLAVNALVGLEVLYLFSSRYIYGPSLTMEGIQGTKAIFIVVMLVVLLQWVFTYSSFMHYLFHTQSLTLLQAIVVISIAIVGFLLAEAEKITVLFFKRKFLKKKIRRGK